MDFNYDKKETFPVYLFVYLLNVYFPNFFAAYLQNIPLCHLTWRYFNYILILAEFVAFKTSK